jgi:hypothetical protein
MEESPSLAGILLHPRKSLQAQESLSPRVPVTVECDGKPSKGDSMKPKALLLFVVGLCFVLVCTALEARPRRAAGWELLGTRTVTDRTDHDVITAGLQGTFRSLKITVSGRPVQFKEIKIHFGNGDVQDVALREVIRAGGESRVIDVEGGDRVIQRIEFWYDAQSVGRRAVVKVYGKN